MAAPAHAYCQRMARGGMANNMRGGRPSSSAPLLGFCPPPAVLQNLKVPGRDLAFTSAPCHAMTALCTRMQQKDIASQVTGFYMTVHLFTILQRSSI